MSRLRLFGGALVDAGSGKIAGRAAQRHRLALLALLATTRRLYRSRDQLVALLWPEADAERGRRLLSDSIYRVNQALGGDAVTGTGDDLRLNRGRLASDVADFEAAIEAREWSLAAELHAGPFLDGFHLPGAPEFEQWKENERARYARAAAKALEALAVTSRNAGRLAESVDRWQRLAELVPDDSRVATELMAVLEASGNRPAALRHARLHAALLRDRYALEPDRSVIELAQQIAARNQHATILPAEPVSSGANRIAVLPT